MTANKRRWFSIERKISMRGVQVMASVLFALVISTGCAETRHAMEVDKSGFLGEELYSKMTKGDESKLEAALKWMDTSAIGKDKYKKIILDPIVLYRQPQHMGGGNSNQNAQMLINYFYNKLYLGLSKNFELVEQPGPGTMRFQIALTDYDQSWVALDMISTVVPQLRVVAELKGLATDKPTFVGGVQAEVKVSDAETGKVLGAAIDRRVGSKTLTKGTDSWADVKNAMDFWSLQADYRACIIAGLSNCPEKPKP
jgi:Protein of unknown function (DUF3313)